MGRVPSMKHARINVMIQLCIDLEQKRGFVDAYSLAEVTGLTDRMVRNYLEILVGLRILDYIGGGKYRVNYEVLNMIEDITAFEPTPISIDQFIDVSLMQSFVAGRIDEKLKRIFKDLSLDVFIKENVREKVKTYKIPSGEFGNLVGDRLIYPKSVRPMFLRDSHIGGSYATYDVRHFTVGNWAYLSFLFISAAGHDAHILNGRYNQAGSHVEVYPEVISFKEKEPILPTDPFYEIVTDFPDTIFPLRKLIARLLAEIAKYSVDIKILEEYGDDIEVYFRHGSLLPHGFYIGSKEIMNLQDKCFSLFQKMISIARKRNVIISGVSYHYYDDVFVRNVENLIGIKFPRLNDFKFVFNVLEAGDTTCLIKRPIEKGKPKVENWYEFYMSYEGYPLKFEFICHGDPWEYYERIRDIAYSITNFVPIGRFRVPLPSTTYVAYFQASTHLDTIRKITTFRIPKVFTHEMVSSYEEKYNR